MKKEVLILYYSQTGQLSDILKNIASVMGDADINISYSEITLEESYEFPWKQEKFYDAFPESFLQIPSKIHPLKSEILDKKYDLIILGYQVWYLTPSIPINSFLKSDSAKRLLKDTPVITVVACRNMWIQAQEKMKRLLLSVDAKLVGHIALIDRHINHISVITISHWMFSGKKDRFLGIFPKPGVSDNDIKEATRFGEPIREALLNNDLNGLQENLLHIDAVKVNPFLVMTDKRGNILFSKWANLIIKKGGPGNAKRLKWIRLFKYYLLFAIWVIAPIVFIVFLLTYLPRHQLRKRNKKYYSSVAIN
ncbi:Dialkylrecorsinol condensing enzyme [hydrothermal vent metagenome]|uniref:Dialkylrecorsinol condensing enzyme n=1 Tax=hydrothermal vent metagenome TaxID=652676 RepID=A0A3B0TXJ3_9ZZZZ